MTAATAKARRRRGLPGPRRHRGPAARRPDRRLLDLGLIEIAQPSATIKATVDITPFPGDLSFCMREGGLAMPGDSPITFTDTCEQTDPFDNDDDGDFMEAGGLTHAAVDRLRRQHQPSTSTSTPRSRSTVSTPTP